MVAVLPALVFGTGITTLGVMRSLSSRGIKCYGISRGLQFVATSRHCKSLAGIRLGHLEPDALVGTLASLPVERAVLIACGDQWNMNLANLPEEMNDRFPRSQPSAELQRSLTDKASLSEILTTAAVPHPETIILRSPSDFESLPDEFFPHAFLKPRDSERFFRHYWVKAYRVNSKQHAEELHALLQSDGMEMMLQEYIPGPAANHYFVDGFVDRTGVVRAIFARRRLRMYPPDFGNSSFLVSIPQGEIGQAVEDLQRLLIGLGYRGIFSAEFKFDPRDQAFKLLEINTRPWWYIGFADQCGVPVAWLAYLDAIGESVPTINHYKVGVKLVYPYLDFYSCLKSLRAGELTVRQWLHSWLTAKQAVFDWRDPIPSIAWSVSELFAKIRSRFRRRKGPLPRPGQPIRRE